MSKEQHTQEPVAFMYPDKTGPLAGKCFVGGAQAGDIPLYSFPPDAAARIAELEKQRDGLLAAYKQTSAIGRFCMSEDDCIVAGIDFSAYERGLSDAIEAFGKLFSAAIASMKEQA